MTDSGSSNTLKVLDDLPMLKDPICIAAFQGFTDRSGETVDTVRFMIEEWHATPIAEFESEPFYDFTMTRPQVKNEQGLRKITWPKNRLYYASPPGSTRDFILFEAIEPNLRWRRFTELSINFLEQLGCNTLVTLGALPSAVPHTRPAPIQLSATDHGWDTLFGLDIPESSRYQGDVGIMSVFNLAVRDLEWSNASLLIQTPHYVAEMKNPRISRALLELISSAFNITFSYERMTDELEIFESRIHEALTGSGEAAEYVKQLESRYDEAAAANQLSRPKQLQDTPELPESDDIIDELEDFLRSNRD